ncbi:hypothetical protein V6N13_125481 [Hibiscus sabdariffa]
MCPSTPQEREQMSQVPYASAIGSIMYVMICTCSDLSYALSMTSRYQANSGEGFPARSDQPRQVKDYTRSSSYKKLY